jgi:cupin domain
LASRTPKQTAPRIAAQSGSALVEQFTVLDGALTVKREGQTSTLHQNETAVIEPGVWHDWWNAGDRDARVRVEITPGERFVHMIETFFGLAGRAHRCQGYARTSNVAQLFSNNVPDRLASRDTSSRRRARPLWQTVAISRGL